MAVVFLVPMLAIGIWAVTHKPDVTLLKRDAFEAAVKKWESSGVSSYDMDVTFAGGDQHKDIHVEVRQGNVTKYVENGHSESRDRWTVPHQFAMISDDLETAESPEGFRKRTLPNVTVTLHATFDPQYGYPQVYQRKARGKTPLVSNWVVSNFRVAKPDEANTSSNR